MINTAAILLLSLISSTLLFAEEGETRTPLLFSTYVEVPSNDIIISVGDGRKDLSEKDKRIQYTPSATSNWGFELGYGLFYFSWQTLLLAESDSYVEKYGKSNFNRYEIDYKLWNYTLSVFYQQVKGYYADLNSTSGTTIEKNNNKDISTETEENIWKRPDVYSKSWGMDIGRYLTLIDSKPDKEILPGLEFSVLWGFDFTYFELEGDQALIHPDQQNNFGDELSRLKGVNFHSYNLYGGIDIGWYFTSRFKIYWLTKLGYGLQHTDSLYTNGESTETAPNQIIKLKPGLTYKSSNHQFDAGIELDLWMSEMDEGYFDVQDTNLFFKYTYLYL